MKSHETDKSVGEMTKQCDLTIKGQKDLSSLLANFDRTKLKATDTKVVYTDGRSIVEGKDESGHRVIKEINTGELGYVGDVKEDLQVGEVLPGLLIGSQDVANNLETLTKYKVTHILNVATLVVDLYPYKFKYLDIAMLDIPEAPILHLFKKAFEFIETARENGCVFVHCNAGVSRSATFVIGYLMWKEGMSYQTALDLVHLKRPAINPNPGFRQQLKHYQILLEKEKEKLRAESEKSRDKKRHSFKKSKSLSEEDCGDQRESSSEGKSKKKGIFHRLNSRLERMRKRSGSKSFSEGDPSSELSEVSPVLTSTSNCSSADEDESVGDSSPSQSTGALSPDSSSSPEEEEVTVTLPASPSRVSGGHGS